jgi:hypothetical protein
MVVITAIALFGAYSNPIVSYAVQEKMIEVESQAPVMDRIARCESGNTHYAKNGQVLVMGNSNKSVDIGLYQINQKVWGSKATELGYNLFDEQDNKAMAYYIFKHHGTEPWYASSKCWQ